jgi:type IV pilus assembly protein PilM
MLKNIFNPQRKRFLVIDFGQYAVKILYCEAGSGYCKILNFDTKVIAEAQANRETQLLNFINSFIKVNSIANKDVYLAVSHQEFIIIKQIIIPQLPQEEVTAAARWQLKEEIPFSLDNACIEWQPIREYTDEEGAKKSELAVAIAKKEMIDDYLLILHKCGLIPQGITTSPFSYTNILASYLKKPPLCAILDIGYKESVMGIYQAGNLYFTRKLAFSSNGLTQCLSTTFVSDKGKVTLSYEGAENIKNKIGIPTDSGQPITETIMPTQIISLMRPLLEALVRELKLSFDYFSSHFNTDRNSILYMAGAGANLKNLSEYLSRELNITVGELPLPECLVIEERNKEKINNSRNQIVNALAAGIAKENSINLLPVQIKQQRKEYVERAFLRITVFTVSLLSLFFFFIARFEINDYKKRLRAAELHLSTIAHIKDLNKDIEEREALLSAIQQSRVPVEGLLKIISALIPKELTLRELSLDQQVNKLVLKGILFGSEGNAEGILTNFMQQLENTSFAYESTLVFSRKTQGVEQFEISCDLRQ